MVGGVSVVGVTVVGGVSVVGVTVVGGSTGVMSSHSICWCIECTPSGPAMTSKSTLSTLVTLNVCCVTRNASRSTLLMTPISLPWS